MTVSLYNVLSETLLQELDELTEERLILGLAVGWMESEFRALGVPRSERGARTDELIEFLQQSFTQDVVQRNGQDFLFDPKPPLCRLYTSPSPGDRG